MPDEKTPGRYPTPRSMEAPQHATTQIPKVQVPSTQMEELLTHSKATNEAVKNIGNEVAEINAWKNGVEEWREDVNARLKNNSARVGQPSKPDLDNQAAIAAEAARRVDMEARIDRIEKKTDVQTAMLNELLDGAKSIFKNPFVRALGVAIATALAAKYGIKVLP